MDCADQYYTGATETGPLAIYQKVKDAFITEGSIGKAGSLCKIKLVDDFKLFISSKNLKKNGKGNIKKYFKSFLKGKMNEIERVNLFGDKLLSYKIK